MTTATRSKVSLVIPAYNEESNIKLLREVLTELFDSNPDHDFEMVLVDDHSSDATGDKVKEWADEDERIRYVRLSRNSGSHAALYAGMTECTGDAAVFLAADLQDPPQVVAKMIEHWKGGSDVVWAVRVARHGEKLSVKLFSRIYHVIMKRFILPQMPSSGADFFLIGRKVIDAYKTINERNADFMNMVLWMGFRQSVIPYEKAKRASGVSKWTLRKKVKLFVV
jgi:glycosyltransferase involved in cell wall biosynthesis